VDISKINFALEDEISVLVDLIQRPIVKEINGWIVEEGVLQVPKVRWEGEGEERRGGEGKGRHG
jgi:hypothetical protein